MTTSTATNVNCCKSCCCIFVQVHVKLYMQVHFVVIVICNHLVLKLGNTANIFFVLSMESQETEFALLHCRLKESKHDSSIFFQLLYVFHINVMLRFG